MTDILCFRFGGLYCVTWVLINVCYVCKHLGIDKILSQILFSEVSLNCDSHLRKWSSDDLHYVNFDQLYVACKKVGKTLHLLYQGNYL